MNDQDREYLRNWQFYLDGIPNNWPISRLEATLADITAIRFQGGGEIYNEVARMINTKIKELRETRGETVCPTTPSDPSTLP